MDTVKRLCEESEKSFNPAISLPENLAGVDFHHRAAVVVWHFVRDMEEGGFALWFERGFRGRRTLGPFLARMNSKATHRVIQMIKVAFDRREMAEFTMETPTYADLDKEFWLLHDDFCAAAEKFVRKCPGCPADSLDGPHKLSCSYGGVRRMSIPVLMMGDKLVIDPDSAMAKIGLEAIRRGN